VRPSRSSASSSRARAPCGSSSPSRSRTATRRRCSSSPCPHAFHESHGNVWDKFVAKNLDLRQVSEPSWASPTIALSPTCLSHLDQGDTPATFKAVITWRDRSIDRRRRAAAHQDPIQPLAAVLRALLGRRASPPRSFSGPGQAGRRSRLALPSSVPPASAPGSRSARAASISTRAELEAYPLRLDSSTTCSIIPTSPPSDAHPAPRAVPHLRDATGCTSMTGGGSRASSLRSMETQGYASCMRAATTSRASCPTSAARR